MAHQHAGGLPVRRPVVLVVDDEADIRALVRKALQLRLQAEVHEAANAEEALERLDRLTPELVISDARMPGMSGIEMLTELRRRLPLCGSILITGHADLPMTIQVINEAKVDRILTKPFRMPVLLEAVEGIVRDHRERVQAARALAAAVYPSHRGPGSPPQA